MRWPWRKRAPTPPAHERTVEEWLKADYVAERIDIEQFESLLGQFAEILDQPMSSVKYARGLLVPRGLA